MKETDSMKKPRFFPALRCLSVLAVLLLAACPNPAQDNTGGEGLPDSEAPLASLKSMALSDNAVLSPVFDGGVTSYKVNVPPHITELAVTAEPADPAYILSANNGVPQLLTAGSATPITITVRNADKTGQRRYIVVVRRAGDNADGDPSLNAIALGAGTLEPTFSADITRYTAAVPFETASISIDASAKKETTLVAGTGEKALDPGDNEFVIASVAEDGTRRDYTVTVRRGGDASLRALSVSAGTLSPAFDPQITAYTVQVAGNIDTLTVEALANNYQAKVEGAGEKTLQVGKNTVTITVSVENGGTRTYAIEISKAGNEDGNWTATLDSLAVERADGNASGLSLNPPFDPGIFEYALEGWNSEASITVRALKTDSLSGVDISPGEPGEGVEFGVETAELPVGHSAITITVTSENGQVQNVYTILVYRKSSNTAVKQIRTEYGRTDYSNSLPYSEVPGGSAWEKQYRMIHYTGYYEHPRENISVDLHSGRSPTVPEGDPDVFPLYCNDHIAWVKFTATPEDSRAVVSGDSGKTLSFRADEFGAFNYSFTVTAEDGVSTRTLPYTVTRTHIQSTDNTLKSLAPSTGAFLQAFSPATTTYSMVVAKDVDRITITGAASHDTAVPGGTPATVGGGNGVEKMLASGPNEISITVTAENGATREYLITVVRSSTELGVEPFTTLAEVETWLKSRPANDKDTPLEVKFASSLSFDALKTANDGLGQLFTVLDRAGRYVSVDLSNVAGAPSAGGSSRKSGEYLVKAILPAGITVIPDGMFQSCSNLETIDLSAFVSLVSIGSYAFAGCPWDELELPPGLEIIDYHAFQNSTGITTLSLPASLTKIGTAAFMGCSALQTIVFTGTGSATIGDYAFADCGSLATVTFAGIGSIGNHAFRNAALITADLSATAVTMFCPSAFSGCPNLETLKLPSGASSWYYTSYSANSSWNMLNNVPKLKLLAIPANLVIPEAVLPFSLIQGQASDLKFEVAADHIRYETAMDGRAIVDKTANGKRLVWAPSLSGEITTPAGVAVIGRYAFSKNSKLTKVSLSADVRTLEQYAFEDCSARVDLGGAVKLRELLPYVFYKNKNMGDLIIPGNVLAIRPNAFNGAGIGVVTLQDGITTVEDNAFANSTLGSINFPASIVSLGAAFNGTRLASADLSRLTTITAVSGFANCPDLVSVTLPPNLFALGASAFEGSSKLTGIVLPATLVAIGNNAFKGCSAITGMDLPAGVTSLGSEAFSGSGLVSITIPEGVSAIGNSAFASCASLEWIELLHENAPVAADATVFPASSAVFNAIYVPDLLFTAYAGTETTPSNWASAAARGKVARHSAKP
jgi:uncharacterized protein YceK